MSDNDKKRDDGRPLDQHETCGGYNRFDIASLFQKAVRRSDKEKACFAAYELCRSGYGWNYWDRAQTVIVEDLLLPVDEAHVPAAVYNLMQLAKNKWSMDEGMGIAAAMKCAAILAQATSSHEVLPMKGYWNRVAEEEDSIDDIQRKFPVPPASQNFGSLGCQILDMHTYTGKRNNRNHAHYMVTASRTSSMSDLERKYKRLHMEQKSFDFTNEQVDVATTPTSEQEDPWDDARVGFPRH
jgi:hypothetical protein